MLTKRVLLAENDPVIAELLRTVLGDAGHGVTLAGDGATAVSLLQSKSWDALVLDIVLPSRSGFEVLDAAPLPPVVVVTTALEEAELHDLRRHHPDVAVLHKPFGSEQLLRLLEG